MAFEVVITPNAEQDATDIFNWLMEQHAGEAGIRWFLRLQDEIQSLAELPRRCKLAPESESLQREIRELIYGNSPYFYRILFTLEEDVVYVLHVRHGRRLPLTRN